MVLLIGAALLMQSLARLYRVNPGFNPSHLLTLHISLPPSRYDTARKQAAFFDELARRVPKYVDDADQGKLSYPACKQTISNADDVRALWDHTRLEAIRYLMLLPQRKFDLLAEPSRQTEMLEAFLRQQPHEDTVIDFTGSTMSDIALAVFAGFNWLSQCAVLAGVEREKFSGTLQHFRRLVVLAQQ